MSQVEGGSNGALESVRELDAKDWNNVLEMTPYDQAIMAVGIHGIGKSEYIKDYYVRRDYAVIMLFLGQMADAGDLIGLPDRSSVTFIYDGKEVTQKITEFCPPKWWPRNDSAKLVIFLDEFNRGKPEVYQCIQDMTLNRQLNGLKLPENTRIIAAINPLDDKFGYQVTELDPALLDRFNVYGFSPSRKEWVYWAIDNKVHKLVIGFIIKHGAVHLDPPANGKMGVVYPSRRSWVRLSKLIQKNPKILSEDDFVTLRDLSAGIIGESASASFYAFIREQKKGIHPGRILTAWDKEVETKVKALNNQDLLMLNAELAMHLEEEEEQYFGDMVSIEGKKQADKYAYNVWNYLKCVPREIMADFYDYVGDATVEHKKTWPDKLLSSNIKGLVDGFIDILHGKPKDENGNDVEDQFKDPDLNDLLGDK
jgi:hypothetical protein